MLANRVALGIVVVAVALVIAPAVAAARFTSSPTATATIGSAPYFTCAGAITAASPGTWYKLAETKGPTAADSSSTGNTGTYQGTVTYGVAGPCPRDGGTAITLDGSTGYISTTTAFTAPNTFTEEAWFKTTTTAGGKLIGMGTSQTGASSQYDRHIYMINSGQLVFGVYPNTVVTIISPAAYNDGKWHLVDATLSSAGMVLYVDGQVVATNTSTTTGQNYGSSTSAYLRVGYDNLHGWTSPPTSYYFGGSLAQDAIYTTALPAATVASHYAAGTLNLNR